MGRQLQVKHWKSLTFWAMMYPEGNKVNCMFFYCVNCWILSLMMCLMSDRVNLIYTLVFAQDSYIYIPVHSLTVMYTLKSKQIYTAVSDSEASLWCIFEFYPSTHQHIITLYGYTLESMLKVYIYIYLWY